LGENDAEDGNETQYGNNNNVQIEEKAQTVESPQYDPAEELVVFSADNGQYEEPVVPVENEQNEEYEEPVVPVENEQNEEYEEPVVPVENEEYEPYVENEEYEEPVVPADDANDEDYEYYDDEDDAFDV